MYQAKRKRIKWIDPTFQKKYVLYLISGILMLSTVMIACFWYFSNQMMHDMADRLAMTEVSVFSLIQSRLDQLVLTLSLMVLAFGVAVFVLATIITLRIVGPIFAVRRSLEALGNGDFEGAR